MSGIKIKVVLMLTEFGELVKLETQELDRYLVLACNKGRLMVEALILPPKTRLSNYTQRQRG